MKLKEHLEVTWDRRFCEYGTFSDEMLFRNHPIGEGIPLPFIEYRKNLLLKLMQNLNRSFGRTISRPFLVANLLFGSQSYSDLKKDTEVFDIPYNPIFGVMLWTFFSMPYLSLKK